MIKFSPSIFAALLFLINSSFVNAQYWQQEADYKMNVELDVNNHQYSGTQQIRYKNNSPDTLKKIYFHLFFNAFQPGSSMDVRSRTIEDPDSRVGARIAALGPEEIGFINVTSLKSNGKPATLEVMETILEVTLPSPLLPGGKTTLDLQFEGQVPVQIRRSGRNNAEGVAYSMTQWYPRLSEYDIMGWNTSQYIGREFHGPFGQFDVKITLDSSFTVGASGVLQNANQIGHGYVPESKVKRPAGDKLTWHFIADNVIDFAWAADPDYIHDIVKNDNGPEFHFFYKNDTSLFENWNKLKELTPRIFELANEYCGKYPYPVYSVIQGGDGGMEYPMATLITGKRSLTSLVSVTVHEALHSWYQAVLASNEALYPWMDEGFTNYHQDIIMNELFPKSTPVHSGAYSSYFRLVKSGKAEPLSTHADHYKTNFAYGVGSYHMGQMFLHQLGYIIGEENLRRGMLRYFDKWKFKHPTPIDFIRVMEDVSDLKLDWYLQYFVNTTETIDYSISEVKGSGASSEITLQRVGNFPMPVDVFIIFKDGTRAYHHIPQALMLGNKNEIVDDLEPVIHPAWQWTHPYYSFKIDSPPADIDVIVIDPTLRMADVDLENNVLKLEENFNFYRTNP